MAPHHHPLILRVVVATTFLISLASVTSLSYGQGTKYNFYLNTCPNVEGIVQAAIKKHFDADPTIAPALLRMHFHDCFVRGCDASILLNGTASEKTAIPNLTLRGYDAIDEAKKNLEVACPATVSCADILALAARDSVKLTRGIWWPVPTGRRDGNVSLATNANNLPAPTDSVAVQLQKFNAFNLNAQDLVTLVGAHTIGTSACRFFVNRLYNYTPTSGPDPTINQAFLPTLRGFCPQNGNGSVRVPLDSSPNKFDNLYFGRLLNGQGVLESDQRLWADPSTNPIVQNYLGPLNIGFIGGLVFLAEFPKSMVKMSNIGVLTGTQGQIRKVCYANN